jgi:hypothetical protein
MHAFCYQGDAEDSLCYCLARQRLNSASLSVMHFPGRKVGTGKSGAAAAMAAPLTTLAATAAVTTTLQLVVTLPAVAALETIGESHPELAGRRAGCSRCSFCRGALQHSKSLDGTDYDTQVCVETLSLAYCCDVLHHVQLLFRVNSSGKSKRKSLCTLVQARIDWACSDTCVHCTCSSETLC